jgi:RNA polymerase sigma factor (sigma-70 family)
MDFAKFYTWRRSAALVELSTKDVAPDTCASVYEGLLAEGLITHALVEVTKVTKKKTTTKTVAGYTLTEAGDEAMAGARKTSSRLITELLRENDKLVRKLVNQLFKKSMAFTEEEDLYQSGLMAFCKALEKFDPSRFSRKGLGGSFCTYLRHWIRDYVQKSTTRQQPIKHPRGFGMPYSIHKKAEEIHSLTGLVATAEQLGTYKFKGKTIKVTDDLLLRWGASLNSIVSMDGSGDGEHGRNLHSTEAGYVGGVLSKVSIDAPDSSKSPLSLYEAAEQAKFAEYLIDGLDAQERVVLSMMREGDASNRKVAGVLGCKDDCARDYKASLIVKLQKRAKRLC